MPTNFGDVPANAIVLASPSSTNLTFDIVFYNDDVVAYDDDLVVY